MGLRLKKGILIPSFAPPSSTMLGTSLHLSEPQCPHCDNISPSLQGGHEQCLIQHVKRVEHYLTEEETADQRWEMT